MVDRPCPECEGPARWLEATSRFASVDYFRCETCGYVWCLPKGQSDAPPRTVADGHPAAPK